MIIDTTVLSPWRPPFPVLNLMDIMIMTMRTFVGDDDDLVGLIMVWTFIHEWIEETPSRRALVINNVFTMKAMIILIINNPGNNHHFQMKKINVMPTIKYF